MTKDYSPCTDLPDLLSSFVDTFVDFSVSGLFLLPKPTTNSQPSHSQSCHSQSCHSQSSPTNHHLPPLRTRFPAPERLIAIGDLHGDLDKTKQCLRLAGLIDASDRWVGGSTMMVQTGDVLDRGGDELKILYFFEKLKREAARSGGTIVTMNGNHEIINIESNFRAVSEEGLKEFKVWADWYCIGNKMKALCQGLVKPKDPFDGIPLVFKGIKEEYTDGLRARTAALRPQGPLSVRFLADNLTVLVVGDSVFVHGGLLPEHVSYGLDRINKEVRDWINGLNGKVMQVPDSCSSSENGVVWLRNFSRTLVMDCDCLILKHILSTIPGVKRMIMGHTIQDPGINGVCDNLAIRIDVGMSKGCSNGLPEVLEITENSQLRILTSKSTSDARQKEANDLMVAVVEMQFNA